MVLPVLFLIVGNDSLEWDQKPVLSSLGQYIWASFHLPITGWPLLFSEPLTGVLCLAMESGHAVNQLSGQTCAHEPAFLTLSSLGSAAKSCFTAKPSLVVPVASAKTRQDFHF